MTDKTKTKRDGWLTVGRIYVTVTAAATLIYTLATFIIPGFSLQYSEGGGFLGVLIDAFVGYIRLFSNHLPILAVKQLAGYVYLFLYWIFYLFHLLIPVLWITFAFLMYKKYTKTAYVVTLILTAADFLLCLFMMIYSIASVGFIPSTAAHTAVKLCGLIILAVGLKKRRLDSPHDRVYMGTDGIKRANPKLFEKKDGNK